jgi:hypothetical protein
MRHPTLPVLARLVLAALTLPLAALAAQERAAALANVSFVETCEPPLQRRLEQGLSELRKGDARAALPLLLPALDADQPSPHMRFDERETRRFHTLLEEQLARLPAEPRRIFLEGLEQGARAALERAQLDPVLLRQLLLKFPGTAASRDARLRLCDRAIERGDLVAAAFWLRGLERETAAPRVELLRSLESARRPTTPRPYGLGLPDGRSATQDVTPMSERPFVLQRAPQRWLVPGRTGAVVGLGEQNRRLVVLQSPLDAVMIDASSGSVRELGLAQMSGVPAGLAERPTPSIMDRRLYVVHGPGDPRATRGFSPAARRDLPAIPNALLAIDLSITVPQMAWSWSPELPPEPGAKDAPTLTLHPHVLASGGRIYVLFSSLDDPLRRQLYVACLDPKGQLLWQRFLAQGAPLTRDLVESRQETLSTGRHVPAAPVLADGLLVCSTGLGVVCGLDPLTGEMHWSFKTARLKALGTEESPWHEGRLARAGEELWFAPSDSSWFYRLRSRAGLGERLAATPRARASMTRFLGLSEAAEVACFLRQGLVETAPVELRLAPAAERGERHDAPPLQPGEQFVSWATGARQLWIATTQTLYELDLSRELFYARLLELGPARIGPVQAIVPTRDGLLLANTDGIWLWR